MTRHERVFAARARWVLVVTAASAALLACAWNGHARPALDDRAAEAIARRDALPSILFVSAGLGRGTAFACFAPGVACTAKHVVGAMTEVTVATTDGREGTAKIINTHPLDDIALLDIRAIPGPPLKPLAVSPLDTPPEGLIVCRFGPPMEGQPNVVLRCDPIAGILQEYVKKGDGSTLARLMHLGLGFKGDSGSPLFDPATGLVVGVHVAEENGGSRGALATALSDTFEPLRKTHPWVKTCPVGDGATLAARALRVSCPTASAAQKLRLYRRLGAELTALGRRGEAFSALTEAITIDLRDGLSWLLRAVTLPVSHGAREDAAYAFRLSPTLRATRSLEDALRDAGAATGEVRAAHKLRDEVAPIGARLATLIAPSGCGTCPAFCAAAAKDKQVRLFAIQGANHPAAHAWLRSRIEKGSAGSLGDASLLVAVDEKVASGCGSLLP